MASVRLVDLALLTALAAPVVATAQGRTIYCCDVDGRPVCGDILPSACYGRGYRELSTSGTLRRYVPPPLTAEEIALRDEKARRRKEAEAVALKQRRLDQALLETYPSVTAIADRRDRALADVDRTIADLRVREKELIARKARFERELGAYGGQKVPPGLAEDLHNVAGEIAAQRSIIDAKLRERELLRARFEEDRSRYLELTAPASRPR